MTFNDQRQTCLDGKPKRHHKSKNRGSRIREPRPFFPGHRTSVWALPLRVSEKNTPSNIPGQPEPNQAMWIFRCA